jgi:hypothetical protein
LPTARVTQGSRYSEYSFTLQALAVNASAAFN